MATNIFMIMIGFWIPRHFVEQLPTETSMMVVIHEIHICMHVEMYKNALDAVSREISRKERSGFQAYLTHTHVYNIYIYNMQMQGDSRGAVSRVIAEGDDEDLKHTLRTHTYTYMCKCRVMIRTLSILYAYRYIHTYANAG
jgi:hypothetical protein